MEKITMLTWLHISDLHFRASQEYNTHAVLKALLTDLKERMQDDGLCPDFIAVTGDIAFSGQPAEYALARTFFDDLLKTTGLPSERLLVVPGNHDVNRSLITPGARAIGAALADRDAVNLLLNTPDDRRLIMARFKGYAEFVNDYLRQGWDDEHFFYVRTVEADGRRVALLGLNSAWLCASDEDKAKGLLIGERQARAALEQAEGAALKIALMHHPFDWLREFDQNDSAAMLTDGCDFILHGHLHQTALTQLTSPDSAAMILAGGACYETRNYPNMVNWVRLDLSAGTGVVYLRRYSPQRGGFWAKDTLTYRNVQDGEYRFALRGRLTRPVWPSDRSSASQAATASGGSAAASGGGIAVVGHGNVIVRGTAQVSAPARAPAEPVPEPQVEYNLAMIRELLEVALSPGEIDTVAFDVAHPIYDEITPLVKSQKTLKLVSWCAQKLQLEALLAAVERINPARYRQYVARLRK